MGTSRELTLLTIRLSHNLGSWPLFRQTPGGRGVWHGAAFLPEGADGRAEPDYWVVYEGLAAPEEARVPPGRVILITGEPASVRAYRAGFLRQFGLIVTSQAQIQGENVLHTQTSLPWHVGVRRREPNRTTLTYDDLQTAQISKTRDLSVVCSDKTDSDGQRRRLEFVERMKSHFGDRLDWFGRGVREIEDKWDAVAPYKVHLSLENAVERDYWTEKLADAYLGGAFPVYWGCPNLTDYFPPEAAAPVDIDDPTGAIEIIERLLADGLTASQQIALSKARHDVLERYNLFPSIVSVLKRCPGGTPRDVRLQPETHFALETEPSRGLMARIRRR
jgi:hypothetical protein